MIRRVYVEGINDIRWVAVLGLDGKLIDQVGEPPKEPGLMDVVLKLAAEAIRHRDKIVRLDLKLADDSYLIIGLGSKLVLCRTRPRPNLGKVYLILDSILRTLRRLS